MSSARLEGVDRRGFLLGATVVLASGCARVPPPGVSPTPTAAVTTAAPPLAIGSDATPAGALLTQLMVGALMAKGRNASTVALGKDWQAALGHGELAAAPGFGGTLWATLSQKGETPAPDSVLPDLATLVAPEIGVLAIPGTDGGLVWLVTRETAESGITSLSRISAWSKGRRAAVPSLALTRGDGVPGLKTVYGARFAVDEVEDPIERAARLTQGEAGLAAFRRTEYTGSSGLVALVDPDELATADPAVILVNNDLADAEPEHVLALDAVAQAITTDDLVDLQAQVVAGGSVQDVAGRWLKDQGLA
jgi:osmoprotectant transport system substrate-binding protein